MIRTMTIAILLVGGSATFAAAQTDNSAPPQPPAPTAAQVNQDMNCRRQAATAAGLTANDNQQPSAEAQQRYAAGYYACMSGGAGPAPGYGPPPGYAYAPPPPPPYYYGAYPYPYPYYPPYYYGPSIGIGFGFGGWRGHWR
jgi:hypothetical protein